MRNIHVPRRGSDQARREQSPPSAEPGLLSKYQSTVSFLPLQAECMPALSNNGKERTLFAKAQAWSMQSISPSLSFSFSLYALDVHDKNLHVSTFSWVSSVSTPGAAPSLHGFIRFFPICTHCLKCFLTSTLTWSSWGKDCDARKTELSGPWMNSTEELLHSLFTSRRLFFNKSFRGFYILVT